jgi:hypothetical protein
MKHVLTILCVAAAAFAADKKPTQVEASGDDLTISALPILDRADIQQALGADLGEGFIVVRLKASPKGEKTIRLSPDDFILLSRKDGERSPALAPGQIAGRAVMTVKAAAEQPKSWGTPAANGPLWDSIGTRAKGKPDPGTANATIDPEKGSKDSPLLQALKAKALPDTEIKEPAEGLLYFRMDGKNKLKDLTLLYKGDGGRIVADFKEPR